MAQQIKNPPVNAGDTGDLGATPGSGRSVEEEMATHSRILAGETPWTEGPSGLQSIVRHDWVTKQASFYLILIY